MSDYTCEHGKGSMGRYCPKCRDEREKPAPTPQRTDAGRNDGWPPPLNIPDTPENRARGRRGLEHLTGGAVSMWTDDEQPAPTPQRTDAGGVAHEPRDFARDLQYVAHEYTRIRENSEAFDTIVAELAKLGWRHDAQPAPTPAANAEPVGVDEGMREAVALAIANATPTARPPRTHPEPWLPEADAAIAAILASHEIRRRAP